MKHKQIFMIIAIMLLSISLFAVNDMGKGGSYDGAAMDQSSVISLGDIALNDYPSGQETVVDSVTTINPTADLNDAANQTIPPVPNGSFVAKYENVFTGSGIVNITFNTSYAYGAYYQSGSWNSVANSGSNEIHFYNINFDAKGDVPIVLGNDDPLPVVLSSFTAIQTSDNLAQINWTTQSESNLSGYNLYRSTENSSEIARKINSNIIQGTNTSNEQNYNYIDKTVEAETYYYWLESVDYSGNTNLFGPISVIIESQPDNPVPPSNVIVGLQQNYPNPFNPETAIKFAIEEAGNAELTIYNNKGQKVITLFNGQVNANEYISVKWNGIDSDQNKVASGVYMYKLTVGNETYLKKMVLLK